MDHHQIYEICWEELRAAIPEATHDFWHPIIREFADKARSDLDTKDKIVAAFMAEIRLYQEQVKRLRDFWVGSRQRHHDYYVFLHRQGLLSYEEEQEYNLAMERERAGVVNPLPTNASNPFD